MPQIPIIMPQLGESIAEATVVSIAVQVGDEVRMDQDVMEVETNKAVMGVTSPCPGRVCELRVELQQSYAVGAVLGYLDVTDEDAARFGLDAPQNVADADAGHSSREEIPVAAGETAGVQPTVRG